MEAKPQPFAEGTVSMQKIGKAMLCCINYGSWCIALTMASVLTHQNYCLLEIEALHSATSSIRLQDEIEMLASSIEQTTRSMSRLAGKCMTLF